MPKVLITETIEGSRTMHAGVVKFMNQRTISKISEELGHDGWYQILASTPRQAKELGIQSRKKPGRKPKQEKAGV